MLILAMTMWSNPATHQPVIQKPTAAAYRRVAAEVERNLRTEVLAQWFPRAVDRRLGGFHEDYDERWQPTGNPAQRSIVYQSRLTWTAAEAARRYPDLSKEYAAYARHGLACLRTTMWDAEHGGFWWQTEAPQPPKSGGLSGVPPRIGGQGGGGEKHMYGQSFGIYAAATVYKSLHDPQALDLAKRGFAWLEMNAHDAKNGGYYEALTREGKPILTAPAPGRKDAIGTEYGRKSMNTHIHLLESLTALYEVWKDPLVHKRLVEVFDIVRTKVYTEPGYLYMFFTPDWEHTTYEDSYGHDIETAWLLLEAAFRAFDPNDPKVQVQTAALSSKIIDHAMRLGWDDVHGGFYDHGPAGKAAAAREKIWWTQAEGLNALLMAHETLPGLAVFAGKPRKSPDTRYWRAFVKEWEFIQKYQIDHANHGWRDTVKEDGTPLPGRGKSNMWTECYHQGRALMQVADMLNGLAKQRQ